MKSINLLDPAQQKTLEALVSEDNSNNLSIVYGPPGTGKSHLITALLFELALKGKKVLFASQNTEALDVIIRMYEKLDKSMNKKRNDLCFLDFCLQLNNPACRKVKYLKEHRGVIMSQKIAPQYVRNSTANSDIESEVPYKLSYRYLNDVLNTSFDTDNGIDELLVYKMKYTNDSSVASSVIYDINDVNIRDLFNHIDGYAYKDSFQGYISPDNQLKYLSRKNFTISDYDLKTNAAKLLEKLFNLPNARCFTATKDINVIDYLNDLLTVCEWRKIVNLKQVLDNPDILKDISNVSARVEKLQNKISNCKILKISDYDITYSQESCNIVSDCSDRDDVQNTAILAASLARELEKCCSAFEINQEDYTVEQVLACILRDASFYSLCGDLVKKVNASFKAYRYSDLKKLISELKRWNDDLNVFGMKKRPTGFLGELTGFDKNIAETLNQNVDYLKWLSKILKDTEMSLWELARISKKARHNTPNPIGSFENLKDSYETKILNIFARVYETYWCEKCKNIKDAVAQLDDLAKYSAFVKKNLDLNKTRNFNSIEDAVNEIAENVNNYRYNKCIEDACALYKKYMANEKGDVRAFCSKVANSDYSRLKIIGKRLEDLDVDFEISEKKILDLIRVVSEMQSNDLSENIFNESFFCLHAGQNINSLVSRCDNILSYNNINELTGFTEHNKFIEVLKEKLVNSHNASLVDKYLNMNIDFEAFCNYLAKAIIDAKSGSMNVLSCKNYDKNFFKLYKSADFVERSIHYDRGLCDLKLKYENPALTLTRAINMTTGMQTIERYRKCTDKIVDAFPVVIATPAEVSKYFDAKRRFDYVVFDEASQLLPGQALPALYRAERAIIVGDPHQMPPSLTTVIGFNDDNTDDEDSEEFGQSILDMIKGLQTADEYHLTTHYRSESNQLFEPSRKSIYEAEGIQPIFEAKSDKMPIFISDNLGDDLDKNFDAIIQRMRYYLSKDSNTSFCLLFSRGDKMGLYAFRKYFEDNSTRLQDIAKLSDDGRLLMSTIRDCQGIEGDHTILYLPQYRSISSMWFFNEKAGAYKRLNVAVTRQRKTLNIIMGDSRGRWLSECERMLNNNEIGPNQEKSAKLFRTLLSKAGKEIDDEYLDELLSVNANYIDSPLTKQLYDKLCAHYKDRIGEDMRIWCEVGYKLNIPTNDAVSQNQESVGYRIDIGIYSIKHRKFILGIEMDGSAYHSGYRKQFSDLQRQDILEMKGWNMYRIWSTNWIKDMDHEFDCLTSEIDELLNEPIIDEDVSAEYADTEPASPINVNEATDEQDGNEESEEASNVKIIHRDDMDEITFNSNLLKLCRQANKNGAYIRIKRSDSPEFEDIIVHSISENNEYILMKYGKMESPFKLKINKIASYIKEDLA